MSYVCNVCGSPLDAEEKAELYITYNVDPTTGQFTETSRFGSEDEYLTLICSKDPQHEISPEVYESLEHNLSKHVEEVDKELGTL